MNKLNLAKSQSFTAEWMADLANALHEEFKFLNEQGNVKLDISFSDPDGPGGDPKEGPVTASGYMMAQMIMAMMRVADRGYQLPPVYMQS